MKGILFLCAVLCFSNLAMAFELHAQAPQSKIEYCQLSKDPEYFVKLSYDMGNHLAEVNRGGLFNGGVCWWHSLFQRSALYLSVFRPDKPKPNKQRASLIVDALVQRGTVVEIPGYRNLHDFSKDWWSLIQKGLERWQKIDGFVLQKWIDNISRTQKSTPPVLEKMMEELYIDVSSKHRISWVMLKLPGLAAHAWLVVGMARTPRGFKLDIVDSNAPLRVDSYEYIRGTDSIRTGWYNQIVPYLNRTRDFQRFGAARRAYCNLRLTKRENPANMRLQ